MWGVDVFVQSEITEVILLLAESRKMCGFEELLLSSENRKLMGGDGE